MAWAHRWSRAGASGARRHPAGWGGQEPESHDRGARLQRRAVPPTFSDYEAIISDSASTDATAQICREYVARDRRARYVGQERNLCDPRLVEACVTPAMRQKSAECRAALREQYDRALKLVAGR